MTDAFSQQKIEDTISFHGHSCPGLAIGIRVAEYAKKEFPDTPPTALVCVTETDMCGVDAIQFLTGCTYGKGNLIHHDLGKMAFSFYDRENNRGVRLLLRLESRHDNYQEMVELMAKKSAEPLTPEENNKLTELRLKQENMYMSLPLHELFAVEQQQQGAPRSARILQSLVCEECNELTMESRTRRFGGKTLCIPCYQQVEQKI